jgi:hypothetical protein
MTVTELKIVNLRGPTKQNKSDQFIYITFCLAIVIVWQPDGNQLWLKHVAILWINTVVLGGIFKNMLLTVP